jgi:hypothetical protein
LPPCNAALAGSAAVGLGIDSIKGATVKVRPYVEYDFDYLVNGLGLSATSRGHVGFFVEEKGGPVVSNTQEYAAWDQTSQTLSIGGEAGVLRPPYAEVRFLAEAGRRYQIWIWATVSGDQSGRPGALGIVFSSMYGRIRLRVPFVTVQVE